MTDALTPAPADAPTKPGRGKYKRRPGGNRLFVRTPKTHTAKSWRGGYGATSFTAQCDGRTREAKFLKAVTEDLLDHLGPNVTIAQRILVSRAAMIMLRFSRSTVVSWPTRILILDNNAYIAWANCLRKVLSTLGLAHLARQPASAGPKLAEILQRGRDGHAA